MDHLWDQISEQLKDLLVSGIMHNLTGLFDATNEKVAEIAGQVGTTPQAWNAAIYNMIRNLSDNVIVPIAGAILAFVMTLELIQLVTEKNNMADVDSWAIFRWVFKTACAVVIVTNTWTIVMGIFDAAQGVVAGASGVILHGTGIDFNTVIPDLEARLEAMEIGPLFGLWFQSLFVGICTWALSVCIFIVVYGRMVEIYLVTSVAPIPMAAMMGKEWGGMGQNYMVDRKTLKNPNGLILGTPGSGKSFSAKREISNAFLVCPDDDIIICDPESEYGSLVRRLNGQVIRISPTSSDCINPMDLNLNYSDDENPLSLKSDFILSLCELIVGGKEGLQPVEKTVIDRCVRLVYRNYLNDPRPENMPLLGDLYDELRRQDEKEAQYIATALEIYVSGSLNVFNHRTNVDVNNRIVSYDIKELGKQLKKIGMLIVQDQVWNRVTVNRTEHRSTRYYVDEFHLLLREEQTAAYSVEIWKRFRKWGGVPTGITQNVKDLLGSREVENIFENSDFVYMLNQAPGDRQILAKLLNISTHQLSYVTQSGAGEGLLYFGGTIIPFADRFPQDTELYRIMTTKLNEVAT